MRIIGGTVRGRRLLAPKGQTTRPTTGRNRERLFSALAHQLGQDFSELNVLDAFAGSGALGLEALSRGAQHATFLDIDPKAIAALKENIDTLDMASRATVRRANALKAFKSAPMKHSKFDLVFADPPYHMGAIASLTDQLIEADLLRDGALLCCEFEAELEDQFGQYSSAIAVEYQKSHGITAMVIGKFRSN